MMNLSTLSLVRCCPYTAYFWETPTDVSPMDLNRYFEFVMIDSPALSKIEANRSPFLAKISEDTTNNKIITFSNLNGDAYLIVPRGTHNNGDKQTYAHIANFV